MIPCYVTITPDGELTDGGNIGYFTVGADGKPIMHGFAGITPTTNIYHYDHRGRLVLEQMRGASGWTHTPADGYFGSADFAEVLAQHDAVGAIFVQTWDPDNRKVWMQCPDIKVTDMTVPDLDPNDAAARVRYRRPKGQIYLQ